MPSCELPASFPRTMFNVVVSNDPAELDSRSRVTDRLPGQSRAYRYRLCDCSLWRMRFDKPIFSLAIRSVGAFVVSHGENRFATEVSIEGDSNHFCFATLLRGDATVIRHGESATGTAPRSLAFRAGHGTRLVTSDDSLRASVFIKAAEIEHALEHMLDRSLRQPLAFGPFLDWSGGLAASLKFQLDFLLREFDRPDGIADNAVALASTTDLLVALILRGIPHNHSDQLHMGAVHAIPRYVYRADEFMRLHAAGPLRISDIAAAAGCSVRTLSAVFQKFRGRTPLEALHAIRLDLVRAELTRDADDTPVAAVARRFGFTNASRFAAAFRRRFGVSPSNVVRRTSRT